MGDHRCVGHVGGLFLEVAGQDGGVPAVLVREQGDLVLRLDDPSVFARLRPAREVREASARMAERGVRVRVECRGRAVLTLGVERSPWWQRSISGAAHVRVDAWPGAVRRRAARDRRRDERAERVRGAEAGALDLLTPSPRTV
ncbi:MAG TPA: hypothetical protein VGE77_11860 [Nocardioides sp.]